MNIIYKKIYGNVWKTFLNKKFLEISIYTVLYVFYNHFTTVFKRNIAR